MDDWIVPLANYGFPTAIASYLIVRMEKVLTSLTVAVISLKTMVEAKI